MRLENIKPKALFLLFCIVVTILTSCDNGKSAMSSSISWRKEKSPIEKRIPLLVPFEDCIWFGGQASNNTGHGLPAPEEYFVRGYIRISEESSRLLQKKYPWTKADPLTVLIDQPTTPSLADDYFNGARFLESEIFMREHTKKSSFSKGRIILNPETNIVYFDLQNL